MTEALALAMGQTSMKARIAAFLTGDAVLADLYGLSRGELYEIAGEAKQLFEAGKVRKAEKVFAGLTALDPYDASFHVGLGAVYLRQGRLEEARRELDRSLELDIFHLEARVNRAEVCLQLGDAPAAIEDLRRTLEADPECSSRAAQHARALAWCLSQGSGTG